MKKVEISSDTIRKKQLRYKVLLDFRALDYIAHFY